MNYIQAWIESALAYPVDWDATAGWAQAVGSLLAIAASAFFAIWVPLHIRDRDQREAVGRDIRLTIAAGVRLEAYVGTLARRPAGDGFPRALPIFIDGEMESVRQLLDRINPDAFDVRSREHAYAVASYSRMIGLLVGTAALPREPQETHEILQGIHAKAGSLVESLQSLQLVKHKGRWSVRSVEAAVTAGADQSE
jgi:hypothetical protein